MRGVYLGEPPEEMIKATEVMVTALQETIGYIKTRSDGSRRPPIL